jgi:methylated-DNA-[protein]-cysteine S-methyltransferase
MQNRIQAAFPDIGHASDPSIAELSERIQCFFKGQSITFDLDGVDLEVCSPFQQRVLLTEYEIPRGWVSTYGKVAKHMGVARGARAVGGALAQNPFPIIIPCHRAIRADGMLGGYQGGLRMKRALLELEGVAVSERGKVLTSKIYY